MSFSSPFAGSKSKAGQGKITVAILPPNTPVLRDVSYQYPLKLVAPDPLPAPQSEVNDDAVTTRLIHTVFLLTYGGGIVAGDSIDLSVQIEGNARLVLLTQGSTKIFKTLEPSQMSKQHMSVHVAPNAALVYLPDPVQPFARSAFRQIQRYSLENGQGNICVCDWVTSGRSARGENWDIYEYQSRNEVWDIASESAKAQKKRLLLRDNMILDSHGQTGMHFAERMDGFSVFGTLIIKGPVFASLANYFMKEFEALPRIGGRNWGDTAQTELSSAEQQRVERQRREQEAGVTWSAANVRGFVLIKFASRDVEGSRRWLKEMISVEGSVRKSFGEGAMLCLK